MTPAGATPSARLAALGLEMPAVATPVASYVPAVRHRDVVYTSGQLPLVDGKLQVTGVVGDGDGAVAPDSAQALARVCVLNALAAAADVVGGLDNIARVIKVVGFVASAPGFIGQPAVVNGASDLLGEIFGEAGMQPAAPLASPPCQWALRSRSSWSSPPADGPPWLDARASAGWRCALRGAAPVGRFGDLCPSVSRWRICFRFLVLVLRLVS